MIYLMFWLRFRSELSVKLVTFARDKLLRKVAVWSIKRTRLFYCRRLFLRLLVSLTNCFFFQHKGTISWILAFLNLNYIGIRAQKALCVENVILKVSSLALMDCDCFSVEVWNQFLENETWNDFLIQNYETYFSIWKQ